MSGITLTETLAPGDTVEVVLADTVSDGHLWRASVMPDGVEVIAEHWAKPGDPEPSPHRFVLKAVAGFAGGEAVFIRVEPQHAYGKECDCIPCGWLVDAPLHAIADRVRVDLRP